MVPCASGRLLWVPAALAPGKRWVPHGGADGAPGSERGRKEAEEPHSGGNNQKTIYSFLQMATGAMWLTNTDEQV